MDGRSKVPEVLLLRVHCPIVQRNGSLQVILNFDKYILTHYETLVSVKSQTVPSTVTVVVYASVATAIKSK